MQTVNNYAARFKDIVNGKFRGVSTKYLQCYANWFSFLEKNKSSNDTNDEASKILYKNNNGWDIFTNIEKFYKDFILTNSRRTYRCPTKRNWKANNWNYLRTPEMNFI